MFLLLRLRMLLALVSLLWLAHSAQAQFGQMETEPAFFEAPGRLELLDGRTVEGTMAYYIGMRPFLRIVDQGTETVYSPHQVRWFSMGPRTFVPVGRFEVPIGDFPPRRLPVRLDFAELLESGEVELLLHHGYMTEMGNSGGMLYPRAFRRTSFLLRKSGELAPTAVLNTHGRAGKALRDALQPYLSKRPDLARQLADKQVDMASLPAFVRALNSGQPFVPVSAPTATN